MAPHFVPPSLIDPADEMGEVVLPRQLTPERTSKMDDFSTDGAGWWLLAHEGLPGHALQYATILTKPVSRARRLFGFNAALMEGWGLYAEGLLLFELPKPARLATLQARLMREAHAFLDIEVNLGLTSPDEAQRLMRDEVGFSDAWAKLSVERYTVLWPGQAVSYYYGYRELERLRADVRARLGGAFDPRQFHDRVLSQGPVPLSTLRELVLADPR
jgi:uncharacterized protein (DUF885 family)